MTVNSNKKNLPSANQRPDWHNFFGICELGASQVKFYYSPEKLKI